MESSQTYWADLAALDWQVELGVDEAINETPINRYELEAKVPKPAPKKKSSVPEPVVVPQVDPVAEAKVAAAQAGNLEVLAATQAAFDHCELKKGARNFVFADGVPGARLMVIGEAPDRSEDVAGKPFVGQAGTLFDRMFDAIGMGRGLETENAIYIANILPWRPPADRAPERGELAMMLPFLERHIALANPDVLILMGNGPCQSLIGRTGVSRMRGQWQEVLGRPALPMMHPSALLRQPAAKRDAWADLLSLKAKLKA